MQARYFFFLICYLLSAGPASSQSLLLTSATVVDGKNQQTADDRLTQMQSLTGTTRHEIHVPELQHTYYLYVRLPEGYDHNTRYPVIYLLDGGITYPLLGAYYRYLELAGEIPKIIMVGISYGNDDWAQGNMRGRDFTAPSDQAEHYGGAAKFQAAFEQHFFPLIEEKYAVDSKRRIVFGQSLGGQFVLHALLTRPELFWGYIASNPALHRNLELFLETTPAAPPEPQRRVFVSSAELDMPRFKQPAQAWIAAYSKRQTPWALRIREPAGHNHFSAAPDAFRQGLLWIFDEQQPAQ